MRLVFLSIIFFLITAILFQCQKYFAPEAILTGTVNGFEVDSLKITYKKTDIGQLTEVLWAPIDSTGKYTAVLPVSSLKEFSIYINERLQNRVYVKPTWKTTLNFFLNEEGLTDSIAFEGDGAEENAVHNNNLPLIFDSYNHLNKDPDVFIAFLDSLHQIMNTGVDELKDADREFVTMLRNNITYNKMNLWKSYSRKRFGLGGMDRPDSLDKYDSLFQLIVFDNAELLNSFTYKALLESHFREMVTDSIDFDCLLGSNNDDLEKTQDEYNKMTFNLMLDMADSIILSQEIKSYIYFNAFLPYIGVKTLGYFKQNFADRFQEVITDTVRINYIANHISRLEKLAPGLPAPVFSFPDTTGHLINLTDFKGKYVYLDIWATWCVPCIREIPRLKELEEEFGDEIAFVSISVDREKEVWQKFVREKELTGIQILSKGSSKAEILDLYLIRGIPRFITIDPDGNLIDADAVRPSQEKIRELFEAWTEQSG